MHCEEYLALDANEQSIAIGELVHAMQNDPVCFNMCMEIVKYAHKKGLFDKVKIGHEAINKEDTNLSP